MFSRLQRIVLVCFLVGFRGDVSNAGDSGKPASPIEVADFEEVAGILAWSFRLPEDVAPDEYARLEWHIFPEDAPGRIEPCGIGFPGLGSDGEVKIFLRVEDFGAWQDSETRSIRYCVKTRGVGGVWKTRKGSLQLPEGIDELYGHEKSGASDLNWFLMLSNPGNDKEIAYLNLGYAPRKKD